MARMILAVLAVVFLVGCESPPPVREASELLPLAVQLERRKWRERVEAALDDLQKVQIGASITGAESILWANRDAETGAIPAEAVRVVIRGKVREEVDPQTGQKILIVDEPGLVHNLTGAIAKRREHEAQLDQIEAVHGWTVDELVSMLGKWESRTGVTPEQRDQLIKETTLIGEAIRRRIEREEE